MPCPIADLRSRADEAETRAGPAVVIAAAVDNNREVVLLTVHAL